MKPGDVMVSHTRLCQMTSWKTSWEAALGGHGSKRGRPGLKLRKIWEAEFLCWRGQGAVVGVVATRGKFANGKGIEGKKTLTTVQCKDVKLNWLVNTFWEE